MLCLICAIRYVFVYASSNGENGCASLGASLPVLSCHDSSGGGHDAQ